MHWFVYLPGDLTGALILLKRKKLYSTDVDRIDNMVVNIDVQLHAVEGAVSNVGYVKAVGNTAGILKMVQQDMDAEKVDDLVADLTERSTKQADVTLAPAAVKVDNLVADLKEQLADQDDINSALAEDLGPHVEESDVRIAPSLFFFLSLCDKLPFSLSVRVSFFTAYLRVR